MSARFEITNARIVTAAAVVEGGLVVDRGLLQEIRPSARSTPGATDLDGGYMLPGLALHALSSDYVPVSLLHGAFRPHTGLAMPLPEAIAPRSSSPIIAAGLRLIGDTPSMVAVWRAGERVA
jgi:alpha-D-ribose 1-methylphosphonate 5-triphosphate diphosphatase PhnM